MAETTLDSKKRKAEIDKKLALIRKKHEKQAAMRKRYNFKRLLLNAGISIEPHLVSKKLFNFAIIINLLLSGYIIYYFSFNYNYTLYYAIINMLLMWTVVFAGLLILIWIGFHVVMDLRIFQRKITIESVLPDFLQLTSANIRSGMPIDQSLWYAVRPRFGVLAREIEDVAKETITGVELADALRKFTDKYDSVILKRSFNLLIEGMESGSEIGDLLNRISANITEIQIMKKEMAANVTTYVIFIGFATIVAAPFLFALSGQLLHVIGSLSANMDVPANAPISFSGTNIKLADFQIYSYFSIILTSIFSSMIIAIIKKGTVKEGVGIIPRFLIASLLVYYIATQILNYVFASMV